MRYVLRRMGGLIITLFLVSIFSFFAFYIIPGDPAALILGTDASSERVQVLRAQLGLNQSLPMQYYNWISGLVKGDYGQSIKYSMPVKELLEERLPVTFWFSILSIFLIIAIAIPVGIYAAKKNDCLIGRIISIINMASISIPNFFIGIIFIWFFGIILRIFTPGAYVDYRENLIGFLHFMIFPVLTIAIPNIALVVKFLKSSIINELNEQYVQTAYSKGNKENQVLYYHVLKNALIPAITLIGMIIAEIFSGSIIIEQVYGIPGIGRLLITSITSRDFPLIETLVVYIAFIVIIANTMVDILVQIINPKIRLN